MREERQMDIGTLWTIAIAWIVAGAMIAPSAGRMIAGK